MFSVTEQASDSDQSSSKQSQSSELRHCDAGVLAGDCRRGVIQAFGSINGQTEIRAIAAVAFAHLAGDNSAQCVRVTPIR